MQHFKKIILGISLALSLLIIPVEVNAAGAVVYVDDRSSFDSAMSNPDVETVVLSADVELDALSGGRSMKSSTSKKIVDVNGYRLYSEDAMQYGYHIFEDYESLELVLRDSSPGTTGEFYSTYYNIFRIWNMANVGKFTLRIANGNFNLDYNTSLFEIVNQGENIIPNIEVIIEDGNFKGKGSLIFNNEFGTTLSINKFLYDCGDVAISFWHKDTKLKDIIDDNSDLYVDGVKYEQLDDKVNEVKGKFYKVIPKEGVSYNVTVQTDGNGTASSNPTSTVAGTEVTLTATPNSGYKFKNWQVISGGASITDDKFIMPTSHVVVKAIFEIDSKTSLTISGLIDNQTFTYNGNTHQPTGTISVEDNKVATSDLEVKYTGREATVYNNTNPPTNAGKYSVTYKISDSNPDYYGSVTYNFEIIKANPLYIKPSHLVGYVGELLSSVITSPWFTWESPSTIMDTAGVQTFKATYTPADTDNYNVVTGIDINVNVKNKYTVTTSVVGNGSINLGATVVEGETFTVEVTPDLNHHLDKLTINGVEFDITTNTYDVVVDEDLDIVATFAINQYSVIVLDHDLNGVTVTPSGITNIVHGDDLDIEIVVKHGYKLVSVLVNEVDKTTDLFGDILTLNNITSTQLVKVNVEAIVYDILDAEDKEFTIDKDGTISYKIDAELDNFVGVTLGGNLVDPANYEVVSGSTIVTFKKAFLNSLTPKKYEVIFSFSDGGIATGSLTVKSASLPGTGSKYVSPLLAFMIIGLGIFLISKKKRRFN